MKTRRIALFVELEHTVRREVVRSIVEEARSQGAWDFDLHSSPPRRPDPDWDGVFAWPTRSADLTFLRALRLPVVCLGSGETPGLPRVGFDNPAAGDMAAAHFLERGIRHLAFARGEAGTAHSRGRRDGFRAAAARHGLPCPLLSLASRTPQDRQRSSRALRRWVEAHPGPSGLFADTDRTGHEVLKLAREMGLNVPEHLAVVGAGADDLLCAIASPALSSVVLPGARMGAEAVQLMAALFTRRKRPPGVRLIKPEFLSARESSDIFAMPDPLVARALRLITDRSAQPIKVGDILREIPLSRRLLEIRFKKAVGRTLQKQIWRAHLDRARRLLLGTSLAMPDVAEQSGFRDAQRLSEIFRRELGESPTGYRERHLRLQERLPPSQKLRRGRE